MPDIETYSAVEVSVRELAKGARIPWVDRVPLLRILALGDAVFVWLTAAD